jgi:hypothetical protein
MDSIVVLIIIASVLGIVLLAEFIIFLETVKPESTGWLIFIPVIVIVIPTYIYGKIRKLISRK